MKPVTNRLTQKRMPDIELKKVHTHEEHMEIEEEAGKREEAKESEESEAEEQEADVYRSPERSRPCETIFVLI